MQGNFFRACQIFHRDFDSLSYGEKPQVPESYLLDAYLDYITALIGHGSPHVALEISNKLISEASDKCRQYRQEVSDNFWGGGRMVKKAYYFQGLIYEMRNDKDSAFKCYRMAASLAMDSFREGVMKKIENTNKQDLKEGNDIALSTITNLPSSNESENSTNAVRSTELDVNLDNMPEDKQSEYDLMDQPGLYPSISDVHRNNSQMSSNNPFFSSVVSDPNEVLRNFGENDSLKLSETPERALAECQEMDECLTLVNLKDRLGSVMEKNEVILGDIANIDVKNIWNLNLMARDFADNLKNDIDGNFNSITGFYELAKICRVEKYAKTLEKCGQFSFLQNRLMEIFSSPADDIDTLIDKFIESLGIFLYGPKSRLRYGLYFYGKKLKHLKIMQSNQHLI
ncbi:hypothetical protein RFI_18060 [Reticulomyxa filosa]|uniref:Uncharacterized protein n=1 Tax=Reticulomyxa filosa TaxID=46433 RepID=X6N0A1_RETFI|nr:hypothetical protein RFI_18060 [Reticulomyxa filosa]|eukprot:ETO19169.1 hypothetical protein RFI_18060 [Reticulomyxa filosa]